jgi:stage II sporulation protein P
MSAKLPKHLFLLFIFLIILCLAGAEEKDLIEENSAKYVLTKEKKLNSLLESGSAKERESSTEPLLVNFFDELESEEIARGKYFRLVDEEGELITKTGRRIRPGDRYLDEKNRLYEVCRVRDYTATARYLRTEKIKKPDLHGSASSLLLGQEKYSSNPILQALNSAREKGINKKPPKRKLIAIYHTHNDESYVPTDGTESVYGHGGIHQVGAALQQALEEKNINAIHSDNMHLPHDEGAYRRSRDTALNLLQQNPDAIFDIHRDAAPIDAYAVQIGKDWVTKIQFVVGRENPSSEVTRRFAYDMKGLADDIYPGLIKGIFMGWGDYNQDLTPLNLLLEVGAHQNSRDAAEKGITLFADVVAKYFYGIPVEDEGEVFPRADKPGALGGSVGGTAAVIIFLVATALAGFYFLNNPGAWERFKKQLELYLGRGGIVWKEGYNNIVLMGKSIAAGLRTSFVYLIIIGQFVRVLFLRVQGRLKGLK